MAVHTFTPVRPGDYIVRATLEGQGWATWNVRVGAAELPLTLPAAPGGLGAQLRLLRARTSAFAGEPVTIDVLAENTGRTAWDGQVRLGYHWARIAPDGEASHAVPLPALGGRLFLGQDTSPGRSYRFKGAVTTPPEPGRYRLFVSMVAESLIWFDEMTPPGVAPLVLDVAIEPPVDVGVCP